MRLILMIPHSVGDNETEYTSIWTSLNFLLMAFCSLCYCFSFFFRRGIFVLFFNHKVFVFVFVFYRLECINPYFIVSRFNVWRNQFNVKFLLQNPCVPPLTWSGRWSQLSLSKEREGEKNFLPKRAKEERCASSILNQNSVFILLLKCYIMIRYIMIRYYNTIYPLSQCTV